MIKKKNDTLIYRGRGKESGLDVYELDEPVLFFPLSRFYSVTSIILQAPFLHSSASQLKLTPAARVER